VSCVSLFWFILILQREGAWAYLLSNGERKFHWILSLVLFHFWLHSWQMFHHWWLVRCFCCVLNLCCMCVDFPQVHTVTRFIASEPDELDLEEADVVSVYQKSPDGQFVVFCRCCLLLDVVILDSQWQVSGSISCCFSVMSWLCASFDYGHAER